MVFIVNPRNEAVKALTLNGSRIGRTKKNHMICTRTGVFLKTSTKTVAGQFAIFFFEYLAAPTNKPSDRPTIRQTTASLTVFTKPCINNSQFTKTLAKSQL